MSSPLPPVTIAGSVLTGGLHVSALLDNDADEEALLLSYASETIEAGERLVVVVDPDERALRIRQLEARGLDVDGLTMSSQLMLVDWAQAYLPNGWFDAEAMLERTRALFDQSLALEFPRTRSIADMGWVLGQPQGFDTLHAYEAKATGLLAETQNVSVCIYRTDRLSRQSLVDAVHTHPCAVIGRALWTNPLFPFFVPSDDRFAWLRPPAGDRS